MKRTFKQLSALILAAALGFTLCAASFAEETDPISTPESAAEEVITPEEAPTPSPEPEPTAEPVPDEEFEVLPDTPEEATEAEDIAPAEEAPAEAPFALSLEERLIAEALAAGLDPYSQSDCENSWRYENGTPIEEAAAAAESGTDSITEIMPRRFFSFFSSDVSRRFGVDVSRWQGSIDWNAARNDGVEFAIIRCGYGLNLTSQDDPYWYANANGCTAAGVPFGAYIYSYATSTAMAESEAYHVLRLVKGYNLSYPIYLDLEENRISTLGSSQVAAIAKTFCDIIEGAGYKAGIYASKNWWNGCLTDPVFRNSGWSRWIAHWTTGADYSSGYNMWQYGGGYVNGISGAVDVNYWYGEGVAPAPTATPVPVHTRSAEEGIYRLEQSGSALNEGHEFALQWEGASACARLLDLRSGGFLTDDGNGGLKLERCGLNEACRWYIDTAGAGVRLLPVHNEEQAITLKNGSFSLAKKGEAGQVFTLTNLSENTCSLEDGAYLLTRSGTDLALNVENSLTTNGAELQYLSKAEDTPGMRFAITELGGGQYTVQPLCSDLYLDVAGGKSTEGTAAIQYGWNGGANQKWYLLTETDGSITFHSALNGMVLGVNGRSAALYYPGSTGAASFRCETVFSRTIADGVYRVVPADDSGLCLDLKERTFDPKTPLVLHSRTDDGTQWQKFRFTYMGSGLYTIASYPTVYHSDDEHNYTQNLAVEGNGTTEGTPVIQYTPRADTGQRWYIKDAGNGTWYIVSRCCGLYIGSSSSGDGIAMQVWGKNNTSIMAFRLEAADPGTGADTEDCGSAIGDLTGDDGVTVADLLRLARLVESGQTPGSRMKQVADLNRDGKVDENDITAMAELLAEQ